MEDKDYIQNLERRVEDMLYSHRNEREGYMVHIGQITQQLIDTNKQLLDFIQMQNDEIAMLRAFSNHYIQKEISTPSPHSKP